MSNISAVKKRIVFPGMILLIAIMIAFAPVEESYASNIDQVTDPKFKEYLLQKFDLNMDGDISVDEANQVTRINVSNMGIESLAGIDMFVNLKTLDCRENEIKSLNLSSNINLENLVCPHNQITYLDLSKNINLKSLNCFDNKLDTLDISRNTSIENLFLGANNFKTVDLSTNTDLITFAFVIGEMEEIDFSNNKKLESIWISTTPLRSLDLSHNDKLDQVLCYGTSLNTIVLNDKANLNGANVNLTSNIMISIHSDIADGADIDTENQRPLRITVPDGRDSYDLGNIDPLIRSGTISDVEGAEIRDGIVYGIYDGLEVTYRYTDEHGASLIATIIFDVESGSVDPDAPGENDDPAQGDKTNNEDGTPDTGDDTGIHIMIALMLMFLAVVYPFISKQNS